MKREEIKKELAMKYSELVEYLLDKYGPAQYDYFRTESCKSKNPNLSRTNEGLECHHIDEDKAIMLSTTQYAINNPFDYQKADRLVYCNILEHLILHIKIVEEPRHIFANMFELPGIGGVVNFICPMVNDYYGGYQFKRQYLVNLFKVIENNFDDYIDILKYFLKATRNSRYEDLVTKERLSRGTNGIIVQRVITRL